MSSNGVLPFHFPDAPDLQVWNNAAFDDDGLDEPTRPNNLSSASSSWWAHSSLDSHSSKENLSPVLENSPAPPLANSSPKNEKEEEEEGKIDREIEEVEREIARLSSKLHALKLEKAERKIKKTVERRGRIVPAKFMDATRRRGLSLGPAEILSGSKPRLFKEAGILTPASSSKQSRRVSCFWRLQEIDELQVIKERGKSASLSPKARKQPCAKPKQGGAATTGICKKPAKKEDGLVGLILPRTLFKDGEKERERQGGKKAVKPPGRVVASRYNSGGGGQGGEARKRSLPDTDKDEGNKRRVSRGGQQQQQQQRKSDNEGGRVKKRWDVAAPALKEVLPKIRTLRCANETPRDSGPAKRVADLVGRRPFFGEVEAEGVNSVCQVLRFGEDGGGLDD